MADYEFLTTTEAAALLRVSLPTMLKMLQSGAIPAVKVGREWRISKRALEEWVRSGGRVTE